MRPDMKLMPARVFMSGWSELLLCLMSGRRYESFISGRHEAFSCGHEKSCRHENGMKTSCKQNFFMSGDMKTKSPSLIVVCLLFSCGVT